jgi:hypothetical protein
VAAREELHLDPPSGTNGQEEAGPAHLRYSVWLAIRSGETGAGAFLQATNPSGTCYGYMNVPDEDPTRKGDYGRPAVRGVYQVIHPEQARLLRASLKCMPRPAARGTSQECLIKRCSDITGAQNQAPTSVVHTKQKNVSEQEVPDRRRDSWRLPRGTLKSQSRTVSAQSGNAVAPRAVH